jgi:U3 small nucleolar RNA-associated protein 19
MASVVSINKPKKKKAKHSVSLSELKTLGHQLLSSRAHINNLPLLLSFVSPTSPPPYALESLLSLQSFFTPILPSLPSSSSSKASSASLGDDPDFIYLTWLRSKFDLFVHSLIELAVSPDSEETLKVSLLFVNLKWEFGLFYWVFLFYFFGGFYWKCCLVGLFV